MWPELAEVPGFSFTRYEATQYGVNTDLFYSAIVGLREAGQSLDLRTYAMKLEVLRYAPGRTLVLTSSSRHTFVHYGTRCGTRRMDSKDGAFAQQCTRPSDFGPD